jgi:hypothetical protein
MNYSYLSPQLDNAFTALGNGKRRGMLHTLSFRPATVTQLAEEFNRALEKAKLIQRKKVGRTNFVDLNRKSLKATQDWLNQYRTDWGNDNETLENYIASMKD